MVVIKIENYFHIVQGLDIIEKKAQFQQAKSLHLKWEKRTNIYNMFKSLCYDMLYSSQVLFWCEF